MDPDQTARKRMLVWIHAGRKRIALVLSWHGSNDSLSFYYLVILEQPSDLKSIVLNLNFIV
jgi:hypothetical protein